MPKLPRMTARELIACCAAMDGINTIRQART